MRDATSSRRRAACAAGGRTDGVVRNERSGLVRKGRDRPLEDRGRTNERGSDLQSWFLQSWFDAIPGEAGGPGPVVRTRAEVATGANKPAAVLVGVMGSETDGYGTLVALGALQSVENSAGHLGEEAGVALDRHTAVRLKFDCLHEF
jgi:hypothetical protein